MPIFTNNSTFPIYKFNLLNNRKFDSFDDLKDFVFVEFPDSNKSFENILKDSIKKFEKQHLFEIITIFSLRAIFNKAHNKITFKDKIESSSVTDMEKFLTLLNMRIDLNEIENQLDLLLDNNNNNVKVYKTELISSIITFTYKYLFVNFANLIYCNSEDNVKEVMDFQIYTKYYRNYKSNIELLKYNQINYVPLKTFLENYKKSFKTDDYSIIDEITDEILMYTNFKKSEKNLNTIIEKYIIIDDSLSSTKKNRILKPFFKLITCVFFHKHYINEKSDTIELTNHFKKFRLRMKK